MRHRFRQTTCVAPQSAGKLLAAWAVRAGKSSDLRQAIAARERHVMAQLPGLILSAQLAAVADDTAGLLVERFERLKSE